MAERPDLQPSTKTPEQVIADWLRWEGHTWGIGPGALIAELRTHGYEIIQPKAP